MKHLTFIIYSIVLTTLIGCSNTNNSSSVLESDKFKGKYDVDLSEYLNKKYSDKKKDDDFWNKLGNGFSKLLLSSFNYEISFFENNEGLLKISGGLSSVLDVDESPKPFKYKFENDTILYMKYKEDKEYNKIGVVQKFSDNYDYLKLLIETPEFIGDLGNYTSDDKVYFILTKINE